VCDSIQICVINSECVPDIFKHLRVFVKGTLCLLYYSSSLSKLWQLNVEKMKYQWNSN